MFTVVLQPITFRHLLFSFSLLWILLFLCLFTTGLHQSPQHAGRQRSSRCRLRRHVCKEKPRASNCQPSQDPAHRPTCTATLTFQPCPAALPLPQLQIPLVQHLLFPFEEHRSHFLSSLGILFKFCCTKPLSGSLCRTIHMARVKTK